MWGLVKIILLESSSFLASVHIHLYLYICILWKGKLDNKVTKIMINCGGEQESQKGEQEEVNDSEEREIKENVRNRYKF